MTLPDRIFEAAFQQARQPEIILNELGVAALWNEAFEELFVRLAGFVPERLSMPLFDWLQARDSFPYPYYVTEVTLGRLKEAQLESSVRSASGERIWLRTALCAIETPGQDRPARWLWCAFQDVSAQKLRENDLVSAKEEAEKATITKSQFLANMSHEIRTPIQTILGMTELLEDTALDKEQQDYIRTVRFSADVLLGLINDVLDFSKIEAGKLDLETSDFDLRDILRQAVELIILDAHKKGLEVIVDVDEALPRVVRGDPGRLRQIVVNLFKNAVKFTRSGEIVVEARLSRGDDGPLLGLRLCDSGQGVSDELRARLFTPFTQGAAGVMAQGGTGLGLAISRFLVGLMGGEIWYEPNEGRGSVFAFKIPLKPADYSLPPHERILPWPARVLVVDDHPLALEYSLRLLSGFGLLADGAASGDEALATLARAAEAGKPYAACLIDQNMPGMDGWRLAAEITADKRINGARLVLLAPEGAIGLEAKMKLLKWFNGYAAKPVDPDELYDVLRSALGDEVDLPAAELDELEAADEPEELEAAEDGEPAAAARPAARAAPALALAGGRRLTVLLAEDHEVNQELFRTQLERLGCAVRLASDGREALAAFDGADFDLVLTDLFMPNMDGYETAKALRARGYAKPIIAVTASAIKGERDKCIEAGMNDVLVKPFKRKDLEDMLAFWGAKVARAADDRTGRASPPPSPEAPAAGSAPQPVGPAVAALDFDALVDTFLGQRATVIDLLGRFIAKTRTQLAEIEASITAQDAKSVREAAHSIKGAAWNLSAKPLGDAAKELEAAGRDGDLEAALRLLEPLGARMAEFEAAAAPFIKDSD